jgi:hypothetical protein
MPGQRRAEDLLVDQLFEHRRFGPPPLLGTGDRGRIEPLNDRVNRAPRDLRATDERRDIRRR